MLACSGGVDSVVLAQLCAREDLDFALAHCNFNLRGNASDGDEKLVRDLAKNIRKKIYVTHFDTIGYVNKNKVSVQVSARELRYHWFAELLEEHGYAKVITAHNRDDQLETFLINLSRGTGIDGLTGIPRQTDTVVRPLLEFSRAQIMAYAKEHKISWREDSSNQDTKYLRSKIRLEVVPVLKGLHPSFADNFAMTQNFLAGSSSILKTHIQDLKDQLFIRDKAISKIPVASLKELQPLKPYVHALFRDYGFTEWDNVTGLLTTTSGKEVRSKTHRLIKDREYLLLQKIGPDAPSKECYALDAAAQLPVKFVITDVGQMNETADEILYIDKETLNDRLYVRKWRKGDYFYPLGMKGKKKISKFFKDEKMDKIAKEEQWLLCCGEQVVWVIGKRVDDRFRVTDKTKNILKFMVVR